MLTKEKCKECECSKGISQKIPMAFEEWFEKELHTSFLTTQEVKEIAWKAYKRGLASGIRRTRKIDIC